MKLKFDPQVTKNPDLCHCSQNRVIRLSPPPIFISTNHAHINPLHLRDLYTHCNYSTHRFPNILADGRVEPVDVDKLRLALSNSSVVVSVFSKPEFVPSSTDISNPIAVGGDWFAKLMSVSPFNGRLVGFGRAVSDSGFTASIYDLPELEVLQLWENNFTGNIPPSLGSNGKLQTLDLSSNKLTGMLPPFMCSGNKLETLITLSNFLFGPIPESIGEYKSLRRIRMGENFLNGSIPKGLLSLPTNNITKIPTTKSRFFVICGSNFNFILLDFY